MYIWNFYENDEIWYEEPLPTVEACLNAAREAKADDEPNAEVVYIGKVVPFAPSVDIFNLLDNLEDDANQECGEVAEGWNSYDYNRKDELEELQKKMDQVLNLWLKKYGYDPKFFTIENIKEYAL